MALAACGSDDSGGSSTADNAAATSPTQAAPAPAATSSTQAAPAAATTAKETDATVAACHNRYDPYLAKLIKIQESIDGTPKYRTFAARVTKLGNDLQGFSAQSDSKGCSDYVARFASSSYLQFAAATGTWAKCPVRKKCSATDRSYIEARLAIGQSNLEKARVGFSGMPKS
ncbi:MAG: hypothetical protein ABW167_14180 [Baekduia sp.]